MFTKEIQKALEADGEKLRQLTGEDHGPEFLDEDEFCSQCGGERYIYCCEDEIGCIDPEAGCDLCRRRCDFCNPSKPAKNEG